MKVKLQRDGARNFTDKQWDMIRDAFQFFIDEYQLHQYDTTIYVKFPKKIASDYFFQSVRGNCRVTLRVVGDKLIANHFTVSIAPNGIFRVIDTVFHEMTHVMQELCGDFRRNSDGSQLYRDTYYSIDILKNPTYKQYSDFPWEVEARNVSRDMLKKWKLSRGIEDSFLKKLINFWS